MPNPMMVPVSQVRVRLEKMQEILKQATRADGTISASAMASAISRAGDPPVEVGFKLLGGEKAAKQGTVSAAEVKRMFETLQQASRGLTQFDVNKDGHIAWTARADKSKRPEAQRLTELLVDCLDGTAGGAVPHAQADHHLAVEEKTLRQEAHAEIEGALKHHVKSPLAQQAVRLSAQLQFLENHAAHYQLDGKLSRAESEWLSKIPLLRTLALGKGHLSDAEVKKVLKVKDLAKFNAEASAKLQAKLPQGWSAYLAAKDLPVVDRAVRSESATARVAGSGS